MLNGQGAVVTGSTSGIGLGIAEQLAEAGANIMLNGFGDADAIERERKGLESRFGIQALYSGADMSKPAEIRGMIEQAESVLGSVEILVNNAGIQHVCPIEEFPESKWDAIMAINLSACFHSIKAVVPRMKQRGYGRIINIASTHGLVASPFKSAYVAAKHGMVGLTKTIALEVAEHGITVNAVCPGYVLTPLVEGQIADTALARGISEEAVRRDVMLAAQPTKEFVTTEQLGKLAVFLCSEAAASINGCALPVDGGWTAQ